MSARRSRYKGGATRENSHGSRRWSSELTNVLREDIQEPEAQDVADVITPTDRSGRRIEAPTPRRRKIEDPGPLIRPCDGGASTSSSEHMIHDVCGRDCPVKDIVDMDNKLNSQARSFRRRWVDYSTVKSNIVAVPRKPRRFRQRSRAKLTSESLWEKASVTTPESSCSPLNRRPGMLRTLPRRLSNGPHRFVFPGIDPSRMARGVSILVCHFRCSRCDDDAISAMLPDLHPQGQKLLRTNLFV